jgi:hypothetical protein
MLSEKIEYLTIINNKIMKSSIKKIVLVEDFFDMQDSMLQLKIKLKRHEKISNPI